MTPAARLGRLALGGLVLAAAGCTDYLERRDTLLLGTGDAVQTNIATHVIDPWPAASRRLREPADGERVQRAVERYRTSSGTAPSPTGGAQTFGASPPPAAAPSAGSPVR